MLFVQSTADVDVFGPIIVWSIIGDGNTVSHAMQRQRHHNTCIYRYTVCTNMRDACLAQFKSTCAQVLRPVSLRLAARLLCPL